MKKTKLHIFLGAGGVGKTTLCAAFSTALAKQGKHVALLSIDPARRLQSALGVEHLSETGTKIHIPNTQGSLTAALLDTEQSLKRWVEEKISDPLKKAKLFSNPYYSALAQKMATSTDTLAAIRISEWMEKDPSIEYFVVDTAPGVHAIDFLTKPEKVALFLDSKLVDWLKWFSEQNVQSKPKIGLISKFIKSSALKILDTLSHIGGKNFLISFGEFLALLDEIFFTASDRLKKFRELILSENSYITHICAPRHDSIVVTKNLYEKLSTLGLKQHSFILNKTLPKKLLEEPTIKRLLLEPTNETLSFEEQLFLQFLNGNSHEEAKLTKLLAAFAPSLQVLPLTPDLDSIFQLRIESLCQLGERILQKV